MRADHRDVVSNVQFERLAAVDGPTCGRIVRPIFAFPGGRRFHFLDPSGNELAAVTGDP